MRSYVGNILCQTLWGPRPRSQFTILTAHLEKKKKEKKEEGKRRKQEGE